MTDINIARLIIGGLLLVVVFLARKIWKNGSKDMSGIVDGYIVLFSLTPIIISFIILLIVFFFGSVSGNPIVMSLAYSVLAVLTGLVFPFIFYGFLFIKDTFRKKVKR